MNWNLSVSGTPGTLGNNFVVALYDPSNPSSFPASPVFQQAITTGFPGPFSVTATGLQAIVYNFYLWDTSGTTPGGTVRNQFSMQPTIQTLQVRADLYLIADTSPGLSSTSPTYTDPTNSLAGWTYSFEQIGYGTLQSGVDYIIGAFNNPTLTGGNPNSGQKYCLHFLPIVSNQPITTTAPTIISSFKLVTVTTTLTNADMGKLVAIQGAGTAITVTLPAVGSVPDNESLFLLSSGGVHKNVIVQAAGSDSFQWLQYSNQTTPQTQMILGQSEQMLLIKANGIWNIAQVSDGVKMVGEIVYDYNLVPINTLQCAGQLLNRADYPRLWAFVQKIDGSMLVSDVQWTTGTATINSTSYFVYHGCFSQGDGVNTFRLPLLYDSQYGFMRIVDGITRKAASYEIETIRKHTHTMMGNIGSGITGSGGPYYLNVAAGNGSYSGGGGDKFGRGTSPDATLRTGNDNGVTLSSPTETKPTNIGVYALIRV